MAFLYRSQVSSLGLLLSFSGQLGRLYPLRGCVWCLGIGIAGMVSTHDMAGLLSHTRNFGSCHSCCKNKRRASSWLGFRSWAGERQLTRRQLLVRGCFPSLSFARSSTLELVQSLRLSIRKFTVLYDVQ